MSEGVEVVQRFMDALGRGDVGTCKQWLHPAFVLSQADGLPYGGDYYGADGFVDFLRSVNRHFLLEMKDREVLDAGSCVVVRVRCSLTSKVTGRSLETTALDIYRVEDGKVSGIDVYYKDSHAVHELLVDQRSGAR